MPLVILQYLYSLQIKGDSQNNPEGKRSLRFLKLLNFKIYPYYRATGGRLDSSGALYRVFRMYLVSNLGQMSVYSTEVCSLPQTLRDKLQVGVFILITSACFQA
jgi:hypothetical protein